MQELKKSRLIKGLIVTLVLSAVMAVLFWPGRHESAIVLPEPRPTIKVTTDTSKERIVIEIPELPLYEGADLVKAFKKTEDELVGYSLEYKVEDTTVFDVSTWYLNKFTEDKVEIIAYPDELREVENEVFFSVKVDNIRVNYIIESELGEDHVEIIVDVPLH